MDLTVRFVYKCDQRSVLGSGDALVTIIIEHTVVYKCLQRSVLSRGGSYDVPTVMDLIDCRLVCFLCEALGRSCEYFSIIIVVS